MSNDKQKVSMKDLYAASTRVLEREHLNPDRVGCPDRTVLMRMANFSDEHIPVDQQIVLHVTECYPCFKELVELRAKRKK